MNSMDSTQLASLRKELRNTLDAFLDFDGDYEFANYILESLLTCVHASVNLGIIYKRRDTYDYENLLYAMFTQIDEVFNTIDSDDDVKPTIAYIRLCMGKMLRSYIKIISEANNLPMEMDLD
jgi:hypothetical protein